MTADRKKKLRSCMTASCHFSECRFKPALAGSTLHHTSMPIVNHFRDLGSHVCMNKTRFAPTPTKRVRKPIGMTKRLGMMRLIKNRKTEIIQINILPAALLKTLTKLLKGCILIPHDQPIPYYLPINQTRKKLPYGAFSFVQWPKMGCQVRSTRTHPFLGAPLGP